MTHGICTPKYQFNLLFKNKNTSLLNITLKDNFFDCNSTCAKATVFEIRAVVNGKTWNVTKVDLEEINEGKFLQKYFFADSFYFMNLHILFRKNKKLNSFYENMSQMKPIILRSRGFPCVRTIYSIQGRTSE